MTNKKIGIVMGSDSDLVTMKEAINILKEFGLDFDVNIISPTVHQKESNRTQQSRKEI